MTVVDLKIEGMSCQHCVGRLKKALDATKGVKSAEVSVGFAKVTFDEAICSVADLHAVINKVGYKVHVD